LIVAATELSCNPFICSDNKQTALTVNSLSEEMWKQYHGKVFAELIKKGVACIMPGHITLPYKPLFPDYPKLNVYLQ